MKQNRIMSRFVVTVFIIFVFINKSSTFLWEPEIKQRIFSNRDEIFERLEPILPKDETDCIPAFKFFINGFLDGRRWSEEQLDSWGKMPNGIFSKNLIDFGHYDQCIRSTSYKLYNYCQFTMTNKYDNSSFVMGFCTPTACSPTTTQIILNEFMNSIDYVVSFSEFEQGCSKDLYPSNPWTSLQWSVAIIFWIVFALTILSTVYELYYNSTHQQTCGILKAFSLYKNLDYILEIKVDRGAQTSNYLNGLTVISVAWFVVLNVFNYYEKTLAMMNRDDIETLPEFTLDLAACVIFVIGGMNLSQKFFESKLKKEPFQCSKEFLHKILEIVPAYYLTIFFLALFVIFLGSGPAWFTVEKNLTEPCRKNWWASLLFLQNWADLNHCNPPTWYISVAVQLYLITPLILISLSKYRNPAVITLLFIIVSSMASVFIISKIYGFDFEHTTDVYLRWIKYPTWTWLSPWIIGIFLGYQLVYNENYKGSMRPVVQGMIWIGVILVMVATIVYPLPETQSHLGFRNFSFGAYQSVYKLVWSSCIGWIILNCAKGNGGIVSWILSFGIYQPLAKLAYGVLLLHYPIIVITQGLQRTSSYFSVYLAFHQFLGVYGVSLVASLLLNLFIVRPILNFEATVYRIIQLRK